MSKTQAKLGARCPNCNRLGPNESAQVDCPDCSYAPQEAAYIEDAKCPGDETCAWPVFHHPSGKHFWVFDGYAEPGVRACLHV